MIPFNIYPVDKEKLVKNGHPRRDVSEEVRRLIFERDNWECVFCGSTYKLQIDHISGDSTNSAVDNLRVLCGRCNRTRSRGHDMHLERQLTLAFRIREYDVPRLPIGHGRYIDLRRDKTDGEYERLLQLYQRLYGEYRDPTRHRLVDLEGRPPSVRGGRRERSKVADGPNQP